MLVQRDIFMSRHRGGRLIILKSVMKIRKKTNVIFISWMEKESDIRLLLLSDQLKVSSQITYISQELSEKICSVIEEWNAKKGSAHNYCIKTENK